MEFKSLVPSLWGRHADMRNPFQAMQREMDRLFEDFGKRFPFPGEENGFDSLSPVINVSETDTEIEVTAELPGVDEKDIDVTLVDNRLTIKGEKNTDKEKKEKNYHLVERSYGSFQRSITLPFAIESGQVKANFEKGVLTVTLPKPPEIEAKTKKIAITSGN